MIPDNCIMDLARVPTNSCTSGASTSYDDLSQTSFSAMGRPLASSTPTPPGGTAGTKLQESSQTFFRPWESNSTRKVVKTTHIYEKHVSTPYRGLQMRGNTHEIPVQHSSRMAQCMESHPGDATSYEHSSSFPYQVAPRDGRCLLAAGAASVSRVSSATIDTYSTHEPYQCIPLGLDRLLLQKKHFPNKIPGAKSKRKRARKTIRLLADEENEDSGYQSNMGTPDGLDDKYDNNSPTEESKAQHGTSCPKLKKLPSTAVQLMESWYRVNFDNPYPAPDVIQHLAVVGNLTVGQVKKWMANKRVRSFNTLSFNGAVHPKKRRRLEREQAARHGTVTQVARVFPMHAAGFMA